MLINGSFFTLTELLKLFLNVDISDSVIQTHREKYIIILASLAEMTSQYFVVVIELVVVRKIYSVR